MQFLFGNLWIFGSGKKCIPGTSQRWVLSETDLCNYLHARQKREVSFFPSILLWTFSNIQENCTMSTVYLLSRLYSSHCALLALSCVYPEVEFYTRSIEAAWNFQSVLTSKLADTHLSYPSWKYCSCFFSACAFFQALSTFIHVLPGCNPSVINFFNLLFLT